MRTAPWLLTAVIALSLTLAACGGKTVQAGPGEASPASVSTAPQPVAE